MELDLRQILGFARRWWWLLLLAPIISALAANYVETRAGAAQPTATYTTSATLLINPMGNTGRLAYRAETYAELALTDPVVEPVVSDLDLPFDVATLKEMVRVVPVLNTELLTLVVTDTDAERAAAIANAVADQFVAFLGTRGDELAGLTRSALEQQISDAQLEVDELTSQFRALEQSADDDDAEAQAQLATLRARLDQQQEAVSQLLSELQRVDLTTATTQPPVSVIEQAPVPAVANPVDEGRPTVPLAAIAGLLVATAALVLVEFFDTSVRTGTNVAAVADTPVLSTVPRLRRLRNPAARLFIMTRSHDPAAEAIRLLRTSIEFAAASGPVKRLVVSSPRTGEGKSTVAANLAVSLAQAGLATVLIDADLRRPIQHRIFAVSNSRGLTTLLRRPELEWADEAHDPHIANLTVIPSGPLPPNPADLLSLDRLEHLLDEVGRAVDVIVLDTPPLLAVSDALAVAAHADGVLLVGWIGRTPIGALQRAVATLRHGSVHVVGVVLNGRSRRDLDGDGNAGSYYTGSSERPETRSMSPASGTLAENGHGRDGVSRTNPPERVRTSQ